MKSKNLKKQMVGAVMSSAILLPVMYSQSNLVAEAAYAEQAYPGQTDPGIPVDSTNIKKDIDTDGFLTYTKELNGYRITYRTSTEQNVPTSDRCVADKVTTYYSNIVDLNAKSVMDSKLDDYSNNGYFEKVLNPNNHPSIVNSTIYGPGNLEVQHWQTGSNEAVTMQNWRIVFATDYAIDNAIMKVTLPYEGVVISDATEWLINRYYPAVTGTTSHYNTPIGYNLLNITGNVATFDLGNVSANSALSVVFTKKFDTPQNLSNNLPFTQVNVLGTWNEADLIRQLEEKKLMMKAQGATEEEIAKVQLDYIYNPLTPVSEQYINETCAVPTTETPTTEVPTTEAPTTEVPTTEAPTTEVPTTEAPTTEVPTTEAPTTEVPTTEAPTTETPATPTTEAPATPTTEAPATPTTEAPATEVPTTEVPTTPPTEQPSTATPTTEQPSTATPTTEQPSTATPTTEQPSTATPTTEQPSTTTPTTEQPSTATPTTEAPTTEVPTTEVPTTEAPTTEAPTTEVPTTEAPTTETPTTEVPVVVISSPEQPVPMKPTIPNKQSKPNAPVNNIKATPSEMSLPDTGETALNTGLISLIFAAVGGLIVISARRRKEMK
ncbi:LPXTG cell wall anchor domain-containing protein [Macrococcoides goetzii]|nr:LPXTG cell wall anchor domain-containing protein [Macrococcus goetzii]TDM39473.1 LPXTG cell wall anchor domain-containing protein [Macrococcus goetzii]